MNSIPPEQYKKAFEHAPQEIQEMLLAEDNNLASTIIAIKARHNISDDKHGGIARVLGLMLVGILPIKELISNLQQEAGFDAETAKRVAYDIRREIFAPVAHELAEMQRGS
jgi:hypothetical protein